MGVGCSHEKEYDVHLQSWPHGLQALELVDQICAITERVKKDRLTKVEQAVKVDVQLRQLKDLSLQWRQLKPGGVMSLKGTQLLRVANALSNMIGKLDRVKARITHMAERIVILRSQRRVADKLAKLLSEVEVAHRAFLQQVQASLDASSRDRVDWGTQTDALTSLVRRLSSAHTQTRDTQYVSQDRTSDADRTAASGEPQVLWVRRTYVDRAAAMAAELAGASTQHIDPVVMQSLQLRPQQAQQGGGTWGSSGYLTAQFSEASGAGHGSAFTSPGALDLGLGRGQEGSRAGSPITNTLYQTRPALSDPLADYSPSPPGGGGAKGGMQPLQSSSLTRAAELSPGRSTPEEHQKYYMVYSPGKGPGSKGVQDAVLLPSYALTPELLVKLRAMGMVVPSTQHVLTSSPPGAEMQPQQPVASPRMTAQQSPAGRAPPILRPPATLLTTLSPTRSTLTQPAQPAALSPLYQRDLSHLPDLASSGLLEKLSRTYGMPSEGPSQTSPTRRLLSDTAIPLDSSLGHSASRAYSTAAHGAAASSPAPHASPSHHTTQQPSRNSSQLLQQQAQVTPSSRGRASPSPSHLLSRTSPWAGPDVSSSLETERPALISARAFVTGDVGRVPSAREKAAGRLQAQELVADAQGGEVRAVARLGRLLRFGGTGVLPDPGAAHGLLVHAARAGVAEACTWLGELYELGLAGAQNLAYVHGAHVSSTGTSSTSSTSSLELSGLSSTSGLVSVPPVVLEPDYEHACEWYRRGMDGGDTAAGVGYGYMLDQGLGVRQSDTQAAQAYTWAALRGSPTAANNLGVMLAQGRPGPQPDLAGAAQLFQRAAQDSSTAGAYNLAVCIASGRVAGLGTTHEAEHWLQAAVRQGHMRAHTLLGRLQAARGAYHDALVHLLSAAAHDSKGTGAALAQLLETIAGKLVQEGKESLDPALLGRLSDMDSLVPPVGAGSKSNTASSGTLALQAGLSLGERVHVAAARWYSRAAECGEPAAQHWVANSMWDAGRVEGARRWWQAAAKQGYVPSLMVLGHLAEGAFGEEVDLGTAAVLYRKALQRGYHEASAHLTRVMQTLERHNTLAHAAGRTQGAPVGSSMDAVAYISSVSPGAQSSSRSTGAYNTAAGKAAGDLAALLGRAAEAMGGTPSHALMGPASQGSQAYTSRTPTLGRVQQERLVLPLPLGLLGTGVAE